MAVSLGGLLGDATFAQPRADMPLVSDVPSVADLPSVSESSQDAELPSVADLPPVADLPNDDGVTVPDDDILPDGDASEVGDATKSESPEDDTPSNGDVVVEENTPDQAVQADNFGVSLMSSAVEVGPGFVSGGDGIYKDLIDWVSWASDADAFVNDGSKSVSRSIIDGKELVRSCEASNLRNNGVAFATTGTAKPYGGLVAVGLGTNWAWSGIHTLYNDPSVRAKLMLVASRYNAGTTSFTVSCSVTYDGVNVPVRGMVFAEAEELNKANYFDVVGRTPGGAATPVRLIEHRATPACPFKYEYDVLPAGGVRIRQNQPAGSTQGCGFINDPAKPGSKLYGEAGIFFFDGASSINVSHYASPATTNGFAVGLILDSDFGDAPESYGGAGALFSPAWDGGELTNDYALVRDVLPWGKATLPVPRLGALIDTERNSQHSADATGDDSHANNAEGGPNDEDALTLERSYLVRPGEAFVLTPSCVGPGQVAGWIDWNGNGRFDNTSERSNVVPCAQGSARLQWTVPGDVVNAADSFLRLRIGATASDVSAPTGLTTSGEVEDHALTFTTNPPTQLTCSANTALLSTGYDSVAGGKIAYTQTSRDPRWRLIEDFDVSAPTPSPEDPRWQVPYVFRADGLWTSSPSNASWLTLRKNVPSSAPANNLFAKLEFSIKPGTNLTKFTLPFDVYGDNYVSEVSVNGEAQTIPGLPKNSHSFQNGTAASITLSGAENGLRIGHNSVIIKVHNTAGPAGIMIAPRTGSSFCNNPEAPHLVCAVPNPYKPGTLTTDNPARQTGQWRWASGAGIDWRGGSAQPIAGLVSNGGNQGSFNINDQHGRLVLQMNPNTGAVYNATGAEIVRLGSTVGYRGTQDLVAVPAGRSSGKFYVVSSNAAGLRWTLIDTALNNGQGGVVAGPISFGPNPGVSSHALNVVPNHDGTGWWVAVPDLSGDIIRSFLFPNVDPAASAGPNVSGPSRTVESLAGTDSGVPSSGYAALAFSPDMTKAAWMQGRYARTSEENNLRLMSFDARSGHFSLIGEPDRYDGSVGAGATDKVRGFSVAFSPSGDYLYTTDINNYDGQIGKLHRYAVTAAGLGERSTIPGVFVTPNGGVQRGPDGKMYISAGSAAPNSSKLHVINNPDAANPTAASIGLAANSFELSNGSGWNLPLTLPDCIEMPEPPPPANVCTAEDARATKRWWFFGGKGAIDFGASGNTVVAAAAGSQPAAAISSRSKESLTVTDSAGRLQFVLQGTTVTGANGQALHNGTGINSSVSIGSDTAFPVPGDETGAKYYLVTSTAVQDGGSATQKGQLFYSIIDMGARGGAGSVVTKNVPLSAPGAAADAVQSIPNAAGDGYWAITFTKDSRDYLAYEFTAAGPGPVKVTTLPASVPANLGRASRLAISADGTRIAQVSRGRDSELTSAAGAGVRLFRFNAATGALVFEGNLPRVQGSASADRFNYGAEFSPDGTYLYIAHHQGTQNSIYRYRLDGAYTNATLEKVATESNSAAAFGEMRRGPDGKIYMANYNGGRWVPTIANPDAADVANVGYALQGAQLASDATNGWALSDTVTGCAKAKPILSIDKEVDKTYSEFGEPVRYTITVKNDGGESDDAVRVADSLAGVLDDAEMVTSSGTVAGAAVSAPTAQLSGVSESPVTAAAPVFTGTSPAQLTWDGALRPGETLTIRFWVVPNETVATASGNHRLENTVCLVDSAGAPLKKAPGTSNPGQQDAVDLCDSTLTGLPPWWEIQSKQAFSVSNAGPSGSAGTVSTTPLVDNATVQPGDVVEYRVSMKTWGGPVFTPQLHDELQTVLQAADPVGNVKVTYEPAGGASASPLPASQDYGSLASVLAANGGTLVNVTFPASGGQGAGMGLKQNSVLTLSYRVRVKASGANSLPLAGEVRAIAKTTAPGNGFVDLSPAHCTLAQPRDELQPQCVSRQKVSAVMMVQKYGLGIAGKQAMAGSQFAVHADNGADAPADPAAGVTIEEAAAAPGAFHVRGLTSGVTYWLVETKAPEGHELLAQAVPFKVDDAGEVTLLHTTTVAQPQITLIHDETQRFTTVGVSDAKKYELPMAGGYGETRYWIVGAFLGAMAATGAVFIVRGNRRRDVVAR
ncbi:MAG: CshA/CshB family fibrillar adhesin-related protein [Ancrocorticia sp.]